MPFEGFDFTDFWDDCPYALAEYVGPPPSDELIAAIEGELGYKLPESYIWLMKRHNGGMPVNTCFPCAQGTSWAEDHCAVTGIMGIGRDKTYDIGGQLGSRFMIEEWGYPDIGVAICDCPSAGHDMIFLDYRACGPQGEPAVVHIDQECDYRITFLAESFEAFIRGLVNEAVYDTADEDREANLNMVRQAPFGPLLAALVAASDDPAGNEGWIRDIAAEIVIDKGYFALHADPCSMLLYDIQFWLYTAAHPDTGEEAYREAYPEIIALAPSFGAGGYAEGFVADWLQRRREEGRIVERDGRLALDAAYLAELLERRG